MAYVIGFFAADGYITINKRGGQFWCLDIADKKLIYQIKKIIESKHKIGIRKRHGGKYTNYRLQIGNIEMCSDLRNLGFDERKTKRLVLPKVPKQYICDFVRGYFDGDGNVWVGFVHKNRKTKTLSIQTVFTSCSFGFLETLKEHLQNNAVEKGVIRKGKGEYYRLVYSTINSLKLYNFMYNRLGAPGIFLSRKKKVFEKYINATVAQR